MKKKKNKPALSGKKYDIITVGGATEDISLHTDEGVLVDNKADILRQKLIGFEYGAKIIVEKSISYFGGGAANVAVTAALLGLKTAAMAAVGDDSRGQAISKNLKTRGVDVSVMETINGEVSGFSFLLVGEDNEHIAFTYRGANSKIKINGKQLAALKKAKTIYISSLSGNWGDTLDRIFSVRGSRVAWNPGHIQLAAGLRKISKYLGAVDLLIVNRDEALELILSGRKIKPSDNRLKKIDWLLKEVKSYGPHSVIITDGVKGAYYFDGTKTYYQKAIIPKRVVDTTGMGDTFAGSFVAGMKICKGNAKRSLYLGALNTSSVCRKAGAQNGLLTKKDIKHFK